MEIITFCLVGLFLTVFMPYVIANNAHKKGIKKAIKAALMQELRVKEDQKALFMSEISDVYDKIN